MCLFAYDFHENQSSAEGSLYKIAYCLMIMHIKLAVLDLGHSLPHGEGRTTALLLLRSLARPFG